MRVLGVSEVREGRGSKFTFLLVLQHGWKPSQIQQIVVSATLEAKAAILPYWSSLIYSNTYNWKYQIFLYNHFSQMLFVL